VIDPPVSPARVVCVSLLLCLILLFVFLLSTCVGTIKIPVKIIAKAIFSNDSNLEVPRTIILKLRMPRVIFAGIAGFILSLAGVVFQSILRNPLAEPFILGISSGSALGAVIGIITGLSYDYGIPVIAFLGAITTVALVLIIGKKGIESDSSNMILAGVIINAFFTAIIMFIISFSYDERLHSILFWLYGDLSQTEYFQCILTAPAAIITFVSIYLFSKHLNILTAGEVVALQLGVEVKKIKWICLVITSISVGLTVSFCGLIGFVGLIVPHLCRMIWGSDHRILIPTASIGGAIFLISADTLARTVVSPNELPVGVVTAAIGAPFFIHLLMLRGSGWKQF